jgi:phosphate starvation-inducible protein PhoH and related proteins
MEVIERKIRVSPTEAPALFGPADQFLHLIEQSFDARIIARGDSILLQGSPEEVSMIERIFAELTFVLSKSGGLS